VAETRISRRVEAKFEGISRGATQHPKPGFISRFHSFWTRECRLPGIVLGVARLVCAFALGGCCPWPAILRLPSSASVAFVAIVRFFAVQSCSRCLLEWHSSPPATGRCLAHVSGGTLSKHSKAVEVVGHPAIREAWV